MTQRAMIYKLYQAQADLMFPARQLARLGAGLARALDMGEFTPAPLRQFGAACTLLADSGLTHSRPDYGFKTTRMGNDVVGVIEESKFETPFGTLLRFRKDTAVSQPRVLVAAPMSGQPSQAPPVRDFRRPPNQPGPHIGSSARPVRSETERRVDSK